MPCPWHILRDNPQLASTATGMTGGPMKKLGRDGTSQHGNPGAPAPTRPRKETRQQFNLSRCKQGLRTVFFPPSNGVGRRPSCKTNLGGPLGHLPVP